ncbi:MAG: hypothetical protein RRA92_06115 [Gemmatimonadota bacterium]|nr:hypothetical protein [Gemmatimonadota bacterium]
MRPTRGVREVGPGIALALLHALRDSDTPDEVIEDESFRISLPRRLGLNDVVDAQMRRYEDMRRRGGTVRTEEYASLLRLIGRRPDAEDVFATAGARLAEVRFPPAGRLALTRGRLTPRALLRRRLVREMAGVAAALNPGARIVAAPADCAIDVSGGALASSTDEGCAGALLTAALEVCARRRYDEQAEVVHPRCESRGDESCRWVVTVPGTVG